MITAGISFASHAIVSSFKVLHSVVPVLEYVAPYFTMSSNQIDVNTKHLAAGDPLPPYNGKLRVYNMRYCPYAQRTILALNAKGVDYEVLNVNLINKPEWLTLKSRFGKVPCLEVEENVCIFESLVTVEYLDEVYPQRPLLSKDPVTRAMDKIIVEALGPVQVAFFKWLKSPATLTEDNIDASAKALDYIQEQLLKRGTKFFGGDLPGYADYMMWPWFERIVQLESEDSKVVLDKERHKLLLEYSELMFKDPAVSQYLVPKEILNQFIGFYQNGTTVNYDLLLQ